MKEKTILAYIADNQHKTAKEIAEDLGIKRQRVYSNVHAYGIKPKPEDNRKVLVYYMRNNVDKTARQIADDFNVKPANVVSAARYYGIRLAKHKTKSKKTGSLCGAQQ